ncbi:MAG TPA: glycosyltransferase family 4 protein [Acidimicrobiales bacterium]|nr:glycosyltransferase family 4 protein [Acidimicrobiales bacterium]
MKLAFVVPRYGAQVTGGAETAARMLAERLVAAFGWEVEVLTTCALDAMTWNDELAPGTSVEAGVTVHRFASRAGRDSGFHDYSGPLLTRAGQATMEEAERWIDLQGPVCPEVVDAVAASDADVVAFYPYLYYPTVRGLPRVAERAVLHAAAHDEAPIRLPVFPPVFGAAAGLVFHTYEERRLVHHLFPVAERHQVVLGMGVEPRDADPVAARRQAGVGERPYVCSIGRVDNQKGSGSLWRFFLSYKERNPGPLALVLVGQVVDRPPAHPDLVVTGPVDEDVKWGLLAGSEGCISPSAMESFSLVVVEAWSAGVPVLVNGRSPATVEHCLRSGGGLWYGGFADFEVALSRITNDRGLAESLAAAGRRYVDANFQWPVLIERYRRFLGELPGRR